ncbi:hypothetical protein ABENE_15310 [Asticcacaulis benevestitus DSM 16100 = ATCC BAA-896]|uniref:N-acetyltransferase domain-containing protein n=2 Tax=Asticcacaulis TaxID=76890 RepID=V4PT95_9CAUL|nr:hypothetical protein ABENE_15310 [Asticcacaulis benevestitus DSM 16100 = ATCC BAA-896]
MMDTTKGRDDFVVVYEGQVIGKIGCYQPPDLGFIFSKDVWGKGLTREAARAYIDHAAKGSLTYLTADVDPHNAVCLGFLAHLSFKTTGFASRTWLVGDTWCDSVYLRRDL